MSGNQNQNNNQVVVNGSPEAQAVEEETKLHAVSQITNRIQELKSALESAIPGYEGILQQIHRQLSQDEALNHLLTDEQVGVICAGLTRKKQIMLVKEASRGSGAGKKQKLSDINADDL